MFNFLNHLIFKNRYPILTLVVCIILLALAGSLHPLVLPDEGRYAGIALDMLNSENYSIPIINGMPFFHKPILFYYITELSFFLFGVNFITARSASIIAAIFVLGSGYYLLKRHRNSNVANIFTLITTTSIGIFVASQYANTDFLVAAMINSTIIFAVDAVWSYERNKRYLPSLYLVFVFAALGFLSKGLIGLFLPGLVVLLWLIITLRFKLILMFINIKGIILFLLISLPWIIYMQMLYPGFFDYYFIYQHFTRFLTSGFNNAQPVWFFLPIILAVTLPWIFAVLYFFRYRKIQPIFQYQVKGFYSLLIIWIVCIIGFFSIPNSKLVGYILPAIPPLLMLLSVIIYKKATPVYLIETVNNSSPELDSSDINNQNNNNISQFNFVIVMFVVAVLVEIAIFIASPFLTTSKSTHNLKHWIIKNQPQIYQNINNFDLISVGYFPYDFNFNFNRQGPMQIALDWDNPQRVIHDNWIKEIYDAAKFNKPLGDELLLLSSQLYNRLCNPNNSTLVLDYNNHLPQYLTQEQFDKLELYKLTTINHYSLYNIPQGARLCQIH